MKLKNKIIGLDLSLNGSAYCYTKKKEIYKYGKFQDTSLLEEGSYKNLIERIRFIHSDLLDLIIDLKHNKTPIVFFIEDTFINQMSVAKSLNYLGAVVRWTLYNLDMEYYNVSPQSLKSFITGKAQIVKGKKKELMLKEVYKKYYFDTDDNDICDAFSLMKFGECFFDNSTALGNHQLESIERYKIKLMEKQNDKRKIKKPKQKL